MKNPKYHFLSFFTSILLICIFDIFIHSYKYDSFQLVKAFLICYQLQIVLGDGTELMLPCKFKVAQNFSAKSIEKNFFMAKSSYILQQKDESMKSADWYSFKQQYHRNQYSGTVSLERNVTKTLDTIFQLQRFLFPAPHKRNQIQPKTSSEGRKEFCQVLSLCHTRLLLARLVSVTGTAHLNKA